MAREIQIQIRDTDNNIEGVLDAGDVKNFPLSLNKKLTNFSNLSERSGVYTTSFKVPATRDNNALLDNYFSASVKDQKKLTTRKDASILIDNQEAIPGFIEIELASVSNGIRDYSMKFFADNLDWAKRLKEVTLSDITWDNPSFVWDGPTITGSWTNTVDAGDEYVFPLIHRGFDTYLPSLTPGIEAFFPELFVNPTVKKSFNLVGYNIVSNHIDTADFKAKILTYFGERYSKPDSATEFNKARAQATFALNNTTSFDVERTPSFFPVLPQGVRVGLDKDTGPPDEIYYDPGSNFDVALFEYTVPTSGVYRFRGRTSAFFSPTGTCIADANISAGFFDNILGQYVGPCLAPTIRFLGKVDRSSAGLSTINFNWEDAPTATILDFDSTVFTEDVVSEWMYMQAGYKVYLEYGLGVNTTQDYWSSRGTVNVVGTSLEIEESSEYKRGDTIVLSDVLDDQISLLDIITDLTRMFNWYYRTNNFTKTVYIEPKDDFFGSMADAANWTDRTDVTKYSLKRIAREFVDELEFKYKKDGKDVFLNQKSEDNDYEFGSYTHVFTDGVVPPGEKSLSTSRLAATYYTNYDGRVNPWTASMLAERNLQAGTSTGFSPRILNYRYGTQVNTNGSPRQWSYNFSLDGDASDVFSTLIPYALPFKVILNGQTEADSGENVLFNDFNDEEGLVGKYWGKNMSQVEEAFRLTIQVKFTPNEFSDLDLSQLVYLEGDEDIQGYWMVEGISNYQPAKSDFATVTLIQEKVWPKIGITQTPVFRTVQTTDTISQEDDTIGRGGGTSTPDGELIDPDERENAGCGTELWSCVNGIVGPVYLEKDNGDGTCTFEKTYF